jgi:tetratricopeptide (TPR) repeat protein
VSYYEQVESGKKLTKYKGEIEYIDANGDVQLKKQETTAIGMLINFRNRYLGHGLTLDADASEKLWAEYFPIFRSLLEQMSFAKDYPMLKKEEGQTWLLQSSDIVATENKGITDENIWMQNISGNYLSILPFFIVPGELAIQSSEKAKLFTYESYTGKTIKFFSPEGIEKQTSGKILEKLNLLLRDKQKEIPFTPETFTKEIFIKRIEEENKLLLDTLISEKKIIPNVYQHRENIEIKLREWIGARANIFFIAAEAGSGKTNLLAEIQKQYTERGYLGLLIRAGRMEKNTLKEQVAYLLNIDANEGLDKYTAIAGTQAEPTFILIDGLNEANNAEAIWHEIIEWSKIIEPGSIKFVVSSRANTKSDLERFNTEESALNFLYGENKDHEKGLGAYAFWLTPLDMNEMKGAWESYVAKDKSRYKPLFSFDDIATFDRAIYNQINNPLVMRLLLEIYNCKNLPKKGGKHLHIWKDWFNTFSQEEQIFLKLLADEVWLKGENELLLDDLLNNENLKPYFISDLVNSPYARMKNMGWVSRYVKDMNGCLGFTVEGALLYLLGVKLQEQEPTLDLEYIKTILSTGTKLQQSAIESFLCEQALAGDLELVTELIDAGTEEMDLCIRPLLYYLKTYGVEATINKILEEPTENDWKVLFELDKMLIGLELRFLRKHFLSVLMTYNTFQVKESLWLGLKAFSIIDKLNSERYFILIDTDSEVIRLDSDLLGELGNYKLNISEYENALHFYQKCLNLVKITLGKELDVANAYYNIGRVFNEKGDYDKALDFFQKCLNIEIEILDEKHLYLANTYNNIGLVWRNKGNYEKAIYFFQQTLDIRIKTLGVVHPLVSFSYGNIGLAWYYKNEYDKALGFYHQALDIQIKTLGVEHPSVAIAFNNIGLALIAKGEYDKAITYYEKILQVRIKILGSSHVDLVSSYFDIGNCLQNLGNYQNAIDFFYKAFKIQRNGGIAFHLARCYEAMGNNNEALKYFNESAEIRIGNPKYGLNHHYTIESIKNSNRLAKELGKEDELPEWMFNNL